MPRILAIIIVYIGILGTISLLLFFVINTTINEVSLLADNVRYLLTPSGSQHIAPLVKTLNRFGITQSQIDGFGNQIINQAQGITGGVVPLITGVFDFVLDIIIVAVLSIYLLIEGSRFKKWIHTNVPLEQRERAQFLINTFERVIGGYIRGQLTLSILIGFLVGIGMTIFQLPYAVLLGVLAFVLEFIPVLGTLTSGALCVLIALTKGWLIALGVLVYFVIVHIFEGDIVGPRIVGKAVGLHPALSLVALIAGAELFGVWGALLAAPIAGLLQALLAAIWQNWRETHPEQFPTNDEPAEQTQVEAVFVQEQEKEEILE
jgi:predicted PurR-regulated permease PerM